jgi:THO complex subunit 3
MLTIRQADTLFVLSPTESSPISSHQQSLSTNGITFCWSGQRLYATTNGGKIRILSFPGFEPIYVYDYTDPASAEFLLNGHASSCLAAELHPQNKYLATGGTDSLIAIWDTTDWNCQRTLTKMTGPVRNISKSTGWPAIRLPRLPS